MVEKIVKSREEWKTVVNDLSDVDFQHLVYDLLSYLKFEGVKERGRGADNGRDLEAIYSYPRPNNEKRSISCWLQCKKQDRGVSFGEIHEDITRASSNRIDEYYVISNMDTTPDCKDEIKSIEKTAYCKVVDWTGLKFQDILFQSRDICNYYFPDYEIPPVINNQDPSQALQLTSDLGKRFGLNIEIAIPKGANLSNPAEVAKLLKEALLKMPDVDLNIKALVYEKMSLLFFTLGQSDDSLMFLSRSLEITPKNINALLNKGFVLEKIDQVDESTLCYDELLEIDPKNKFAFNNKAHNLMRIGLFKDALSCIDSALEIDPNFVVAIHNRAEILKGLKKSKEALKFLEDKKGLTEKFLGLQSTKVDLCIELLDLREAYRLNENILQTNQLLIGAVNNKGVIYEKNAKFQKADKYLGFALECFEKVIQTNDKYPLGWSNKAVILLSIGNIEEAEKILNYAYALFPKDPYILNKKGVALLGSSPKDALKYFEKALALRFNEEFLLDKASALLALNHWKEAKETTDLLLRYNPEKSEAWRFKGIASQKLRLPHVKKCFENAEKFKEKPISLLED